MEVSGHMAPQVRLLRVSRRMLYGIVALAIAVAVASASTAYYLDIHRYPSEDTPLVLYSWGISWIREQVDPDVWYPAPPFGSIRLVFTDSPGYAMGTAPLNSTSTGASVAATEFELPSNMTVLFETYLVPWHTDEIVNGVRTFGVYGIFVTDENENGLFDYGDSISLFYGVYQNDALTHQGFQSNTEYSMALELTDAGGMEGPIQFKCAIHHGKLYAWESYWHPS